MHIRKASASSLYITSRFLHAFLSILGVRFYSLLVLCQWDEWISLDSPRLAPADTMTYQEGGPLRLGQRVEVLDEVGQVREFRRENEGEGEHTHTYKERERERVETRVSLVGGTQVRT